MEVDNELVRKLMRELGLTPVQVKRRKGLIVPSQQADELPDLLGRDFTDELPGGAMVGDITQIDTPSRVPLGFVEIHNGCLVVVWWRDPPAA